MWIYPIVFFFLFFFSCFTGEKNIFRTGHSFKIQWCDFIILIYECCRSHTERFYFVTIFLENTCIDCVPTVWKWFQWLFKRIYNVFLIWIWFFSFDHLKINWNTLKCNCFMLYIQTLLQWCKSSILDCRNRLDVMNIFNICIETWITFIRNGHGSINVTIVRTNTNSIRFSIITFLRFFFGWMGLFHFHGSFLIV